MNRITINGKVIEVNGHNISIIGDTLIVDNIIIEKGLSGTVNIKFEGDLANLTIHRGDADINGNIEGNVNIGGSLVCKGDIGGDVDTGGSVTCQNVGGNVDAGGSVTCGNISGDIDAGGSVRMKR